MVAFVTPCMWKSTQNKHEGTLGETRVATRASIIQASHSCSRHQHFDRCQSGEAEGTVCSFRALAAQRGRGTTNPWSHARFCQTYSVCLMYVWPVACSYSICFNALCFTSLSWLCITHFLFSLFLSCVMQHVATLHTALKTPHFLRFLSQGHHMVQSCCWYSTAYILCTPYCSWEEGSWDWSTGSWLI